MNTEIRDTTGNILRPGMYGYEEALGLKETEAQTSQRDTPTHVIVLPSGQSVTIGEYVRSWRACLKTSPDVQIKSWDWFPVSVGHVLRGIRAGIHDRINTRGNLPRFDVASTANQKRFWNRARSKAICHCRFCGGRVPFNNIQPRACADCR